MPALPRRAQDILTVAEAAKLAGCADRQAVYRAVQRGELEPLPITGKTLLFNRRDVVRWARTRVA